MSQGRVGPVAILRPHRILRRKRDRQPTGGGAARSDCRFCQEGQCGLPRREAGRKGSGAAGAREGGLSKRPREIAAIGRGAHHGQAVPKAIWPKQRAI